uniref:ECF transporter S component n=1 Tax=Ndongobacter massiliensis TaxID=1871025 RepID=UPI0009317E98|nr:ECF transporter S component [Ndongobacter massiliensis]
MNKKEFLGGFTARSIAQIGLLLAIILFMNATHIGYLPIGPIVATTMHIPVLIGAIALGPKVGFILGLAFGLTSFFNALQGLSGASSFIFMNPLISIVPRLILGVFSGLIAARFRRWKDGTARRVAIVFWGLLSVALTAYLLYSIHLQKGIWTSALLLGVVLCAFALTIFVDKGKSVAISFAAALSTMLHTALVMGFIYIFYADAYMIALGLAPEQALATVLSVCVVNGLPEMAVGVLITTPVCRALQKKG